MQPINFKIGDDEYQLLPHTGFTAIDLDRKVLSLFGKMYGSAEAINEQNAFVALAEAFESFSSSEYRWLVETTLQRVTVVTSGKKNFSLGTAEAVAGHFAGQMQNLYAVLFEVWKQEKLSPFATAPASEPNGN